MRNSCKKMVVGTLMVFALSMASAGSVFAHCQVPCGIYDDHARVSMMAEDVTTVEKSMKLIVSLADKNDPLSKNQLVRWVNTKELHAQKIISTMTDYFLTQRVKASQADYVERLKDHHAVIVAAMKAKQNVDQEFVVKLREAVTKLEKYYPPQKD